MTNQTNTLENIFDKPWKHALAALVGFGLTYASASWAIDSGRLLVYFGTIVLFFTSFNQVYKAIRKAN